MSTFPIAILRFKSPFFRDWLFWFVVAGVCGEGVTIAESHALYNPYPGLVMMCWFIPWFVVGLRRAWKRETQFE